MALPVALGFGSPIPAAIIGTNPPVLPLTTERIASLPAASGMAWKEYLEHSERQRKADQLFFQNEMKDHDIKQSVIPPTGRASYSMPLDNRAIWYGSDDARRIADNIVSFQTPAGGWSKNLDLTRHPRAERELFGPENGSQYLGASDFDAPLEGKWNYVGTIDNDATTTELQFLAQVIASGADKIGKPCQWIYPVHRRQKSRGRSREFQIDQIRSHPWPLRRRHAGGCDHLRPPKQRHFRRPFS